MAQPTQPISPLRQRMIEDMQMRKPAPKTQASYICAVNKLADYLGHSPHTASAEDLRRFQLHLTDTGTSRITINTTITALRFFFEVTVGDKNIVEFGGQYTYLLVTNLRSGLASRSWFNRA